MDMTTTDPTRHRLLSAWERLREVRQDAAGLPALADIPVELIRRRRAAESAFHEAFMADPEGAADEALSWAAWARDPLVAQMRISAGWASLAAFDARGVSAELSDAAAKAAWAAVERAESQ